MPQPILLAGTPEREDYLRAYIAALRAAGAEVVVAWPDAETRSDRAALLRFLSRFSGLLLPGGKDVEPWRYSEEPHPKLGGVDRELDDGELALAGAALEASVPTLAICRGIQVLGVAVGGTLFQDLPSQRPNGLSHQVRTTPSMLAHEVDIESASRLREVIGASRFPVNSRHHQAVRSVAGERVGLLRVVARASDGVIEGLELPGHPFFIGVQWHPENLAPEQVESRRLFQGFVDVCAG